MIVDLDYYPPLILSCVSLRVGEVDKIIIP
jgi:hypothetical protein